MEQYIDADKLLEAGQWILCEERLPKEAGKYLVKGTFKGDTKMWECQFCYMGGIGGWINDARNPIVSAWWEPVDVVMIAEETSENWEKAKQSARQEVAREVLDELLNKLELISVVAEPRDGFMQGVIKTFNQTSALIAELKKKYTEENE